jgi:hypothetical protein
MDRAAGAAIGANEEQTDIYAKRNEESIKSLIKFL